MGPTRLLLLLNLGAYFIQGMEKESDWLIKRVELQNAGGILGPTVKTAASAHGPTTRDGMTESANHHAAPPII